MLKGILSETGSQWREARMGVMGVMWVPARRGAAALWTNHKCESEASSYSMNHSLRIIK